MAERLLGIDAGGSGTRVVVLTGDKVTTQPSAPPMNALLTDGIPDLLLEIIRTAAPDAAGIGLPGLRDPEIARELGESLSRRAGCPVLATNDAETARAGAFRGGPGVIVIAGTGSGAFGWDGKRSGRAGGHGFLLGDEGSAYWLGRAAVRAALAWEDQMGGSAAIYRAVTEHVGSGLDALIREVNTHPADRARLTVLAPAVTALAGTDPEARRIAERAAGHLAALAETVQRRLGPLPVAGAGGVFGAQVIWDRFAELTGAARPLAPPPVGAALLAGTLLRSS